MDLRKEKTKRNIFLILQIIFLILTFVVAILVIMKKVDNAGGGYLYVIFFNLWWIYERKSKKINENTKK